MNTESQKARIVEIRRVEIFGALASKSNEKKIAVGDEAWTTPFDVLGQLSEVTAVLWRNRA